MPAWSLFICIWKYVTASQTLGVGQLLGLLPIENLRHRVYTELCVLGPSRGISV